MILFSEKFVFKLHVFVFFFQQEGPKNEGNQGKEAEINEEENYEEEAGEDIAARVNKRTNQRAEM